MQPEVLLCMQISCLDPYVSGSGHRCGEAMCTLNILPFLYGWLGCRYTSCHQWDDKDPLLLPPGSTAVALWGKRIQNSQRRDLQEKSPSTAQASGGTKPMWVQISILLHTAKWAGATQSADWTEERPSGEEECLKETLVVAWGRVGNPVDPWFNWGWVNPSGSPGAAAICLRLTTRKDASTRRRTLCESDARLMACLSQITQVNRRKPSLMTSCFVPLNNDELGVHTGVWGCVCVIFKFCLATCTLA